MALYNSSQDIIHIVAAIKEELYKPVKDKISKEEFDKIFDTKCGTVLVKNVLDKIEDTLRVKNISN